MFIFLGIYGVPKDQVARAAAASVIQFVKDFADPCLKHIHFVDVIDDMVQLYRAEFDKYVKKSVFGVYNKYSEWSKWKAGHSDVPNWTNKSDDVDTTGFSSSSGRGQILQRQLSNLTRGKPTAVLAKLGSKRFRPNGSSDCWTKERSLWRRVFKELMTT